MKTAFLSRFTPSLMPPELLEAVFVQRERLAKRTVEHLRESIITDSKSHTLLVGQRGIGKTHLVSLVYHRLRMMDNLRDKMLVAWLREEEWGLSSFLDLLISILRALSEENGDLKPRMDALYAHKPADAERIARELLIETLGDRTLVLIAENLDDLFDGLGDEGQKSFRAFIQETRSVTILATVQGLFQAVSLQTSPFYGFFQIRHLPGLDIEDARTLLIKIAEQEHDTDLAAYLQTPAGKARVRAVHHLAGGNPRLYVTFSEFLTRETLDELVPPFMEMLDDLTPYYQAKMRMLSAQQRKIVEVLSDARGAIPVKEIALRSFITPQSVSNQLKELRGKGYVQAHPIGRDSYYELQEPLMRLCLEVKKQRGEPIKLFVEFLRVWCSRDELEKRLMSLSPNDQTTPLYLREALRLTEIEDSPAVVACRNDYAIYMHQGDRPKAQQVLEELYTLQSSDSKPLLDARFWLESGLGFANKGDFIEAINAFENLLRIDSNNSIAWFNLGATLCDLNRIDEALVAYDKAMEINPKDPDIWYNKGVALAGVSRYDEALIHFQNVLNIDPDNFSAWHNKGAALANLKEYSKAIIAFDEALIGNPNDPLTLLSKGRSLYQIDQYSDAVIAFDKVLNIIPASPNVWHQKGSSLAFLGRYEEALIAFDEAIKYDSENANIWSNKGVSLSNINRNEDALIALETALILDKSNAETWHTKGIALGKIDRNEDALIAFGEALKIDPNNPKIWYNKSVVEYRLLRYDDVIISSEHVLSDNELSEQVYFIRGISQALTSRWQDLSLTLKIVLGELDEDDPKGDLFTAILIKQILHNGLDKWSSAVREILKLYTDSNHVWMLGQGIVNSIGDLFINYYNYDMRLQWLETWRYFANNVAELDLPLNLIDILIRYKNSGDLPNRRILLEASVEERKLLEQILGEVLV